MDYCSLCVRYYINKHFNYNRRGRGFDTRIKMAAEDSAREQHFDRTSFPAASRKNAEENVVLSSNCRDGLQSCGQSIQDPYTRAVKYLEEHRIVEVFQNITTRIAYEKPSDPLQFMLDEIEKFRKGEVLKELK